jgi:glycosyltransferase involved in cell wall biosynthesis
MDEPIDKLKITRQIASRQTADPRAITLTVGIPSYNHANYINACLAGLMSSEQRAAIEVIVIDDCSPDATAAKAVEALLASDLTFRVYRNETNQGLSYGLDFLLTATVGDYLIVCASDDILCGNALDQVIQNIGTTGGPPSFEIFGARYFGSRGGSVYNTDKLTRLAADTQAFCTWLSTEIPKPLLLQSTLFNTVFLQRLNPWADRLILDDWPTFLRAGMLALSEDLPIRFTPEIELTHYRVHAGGLHANAERQRRACLEVVEKVIPESYKRVARARVLSELVAADLAQGHYTQAWRDYRAAVAWHPRLNTVLHAPIAALLGIGRRFLRVLS